MTTAAQASTLCPKELEALPIQTGGRIKPLGVHTKEVIKYITGKTKQSGLTATEIYCQLSLLSLSDQKSFNPIKIKVDHIETRKFLDINKDQKFIAPEQAKEKMDEMRKYATVLESRGDKSAFAKDLKTTFLRTNLYFDIINGSNWKFPILFHPSSKDPHKHSTSPGPNTVPNVEWISASDLHQIFKDEIMTPEQTVQSIITAGTKYTHQINNKHLLELKYDRMHLFQWAILAVLLALFCVSVLKKPTHPVTWLSIIAIFAIEITAIVFRIKISDRAPVTNMYETVMWVGLGALFFAAILSMLRKEKLFLFLGLVLNLSCLFMMSFASNMLDPGIQPLVPVLRDNFWLSTHVTMITISYAAFGLSWVLANYYMIKSSVKSIDSKERSRLNLLCYDCLKIGVVLLAAGIILGGVWADYSWGRFWGWDPKETWSLIALMAYIAILHGRYSGWITNKNFIPTVGLAFLSILMAWFGVNYILAAGLHSYGFSNGGAIFIGSIVLLQFTIYGFYLFRRRQVQI